MALSMRRTTLPAKTSAAIKQLLCAIDRFSMEVKRELDVLDRRQADNAYLTGDEYSIADMATWPWYGALALGRLYDAGEFLQVQTYKHVQRWANDIDNRPAVKRGRRVNRNRGEPEEQLPERHAASDFDK
jgi:GST-like protein